MTNVGPGSSPHSSFSSARRYLARIFVWASISETSMRARIRASRSVAPISAIYAKRLVGERWSGLAKRGKDTRQLGLGDQHLARL